MTEKKVTRFAVPVAQGLLCMHFGHCEQFALIDVDPETGRIVDQRLLTPPAHEPGVLPRWLGEQGVTVVLAGGMGQRAQSLFAQNGVEVVVGASAAEPHVVVQAYVDGTLVSGDNLCDH